MQDEILQIAARIRELREILEITPEEMAESLSHTVEQYMKYETAESDIPISTLFRIAEKLGVNFTVLLTGSAPKLDTYSLVRSGEGAHVDRYEGYHFQSLAFNYIGRVMEPMLVSISDGEPPALVTHPGQEFNYVLSGTVEIVIGSRSFTLNPGDSIYFNPNLPHGQRAIGGTCQFLTVICE